MSARRLAPEWCFVTSGEHPRATYRLQLTPDFTFDAAERILPYLVRLGVSHVYLSPIWQAASGSTHGYDVIDHARVSAELGGEEAYLRFSRAVTEHGLRQIIDIVPNHMSIADRRNRWWWDVLENGPASRYAHAFDVDWDPPEGRNRNIVLMPILGDHRGAVLDRRELFVQREGANFTFRYMEHTLPVAPRSLSLVLGSATKRLSLLPLQERSPSEPRARAVSMLAFLADAFGSLPGPTVHDDSQKTRRHRDKEVLHDILHRLLCEVPEAAACVDEVLGELSGDPDALDAFLNQQNHRISFWRTAERELDYRRFFDINTLVGLRMENEEVFHETHDLIGRLVRDRVVQGLRVDHVDGLVDPLQYLQRLRRLAPHAWIVVEKILARDEELRAEWPVEGTTGYDFLNDVCGLFVDEAASEAMTVLHQEVTGDGRSFRQVAREKKDQVLRQVIFSEVDRVVQVLVELCATHRSHRDHTRHDLRHALIALVAAFPSYRAYVRVDEDGWHVHAEDVRMVEEACTHARLSRPDLDPRLFDLLAQLLLGRSGIPGAADFARRVQQLTGPAAAKGIEDTGFYGWSRFVALNEVGGDPDSFGCSPRRFHENNERALHRNPLRMLATSTHDTKRSEDVRARLAMWSQDADGWARHVRGWQAMNADKRNAGVPDGDAELLFYQTLVGAWPLHVQRALGYMMKAVREAKVYTSWHKPDHAYEELLRSFILACYADGAFIAAVERAVADVCEAGRIASLAMTLLKLTSPGVPDLYQGTELWALDLVDPDNRRSVDFALRASLLERVMEMTPEQLTGGMDDGLPKLAIIQRTLDLRRRKPALFSPDAAYAPVTIRGEHAERLLAFSRGEGAVIVVPRLILSLPLPLLQARVGLAPGRWRNVITHEEVSGGVVAARALFQRFPVTLLERVEPAGA